MKDSTIATTAGLSLFVIMSLCIAVFVTNVLCIEYCLESWSGDEWHGGMCFLLSFVPGAQLAILAAIITCCVM